MLLGSVFVDRACVTNVTTQDHSFGPICLDVRVQLENEPL